MCTHQKHLFGHLDIGRLILIIYITTLLLVSIAIFEAFPPRLNHICSPQFLLALPYILHIISIIHYIADISRPSTKNRKLESVTVMLLILFCCFYPFFPMVFAKRAGLQLTNAPGKDPGCSGHSEGRCRWQGRPG